MRYSKFLRPACLVSALFNDLISASKADGHGQIVWSSYDGSGNGKHQQEGRPKNIVFILTDDQDAVLESVSYMPRLNQHLVQKGTSFVNHFTTTAICCPARVSLWTGKQPHNTNVTDVNPPYGTCLSSSSIVDWLTTSRRLPQICLTRSQPQLSPGVASGSRIFHLLHRQTLQCTYYPQLPQSVSCGMGWNQLFT